MTERTKKEAGRTQYTSPEKRSDFIARLGLERKVRKPKGRKPIRGGGCEGPEQ